MVNEHIFDGMLVEDAEVITLTQLCHSCMVEIETITLLVAEGVLEPQGNSTEHWRFAVGSRRRVKTAIHLQRDLGVNLAGAALALELLDQIAELKRL